MANTKSAGKRARQSARRSLRNRSVLTRIRTSQKRSLTADKADPKQIHAVISAIDRAAKQGIIHGNTARRRKARLHRALAKSK